MEQRDPQTYAIIGAALEVHNQLGNGFLEGIYQEALAIELELRGIPFHREQMLTVTYKGRPLSCKYKADFVCFENIIVECKALSELIGTHRSQVLNYLKATGFHRGLLLNFGTASLRHERLVWGPEPDLQSKSSIDFADV
jgi:GxxExxY protein